MYFNTRNIAGVLKVNGFIQGTVSVIFYKQKKMLLFSKKCSLLKPKKIQMLAKFPK